MKKSLKSILRPLLLPWSGLWDPIYIRWTRWRTGFQSPIPPIRIRQRAGGSGADVFWFIQSGKLDAEVFLSAIKRHADRPLSDQHVLDFGAGIGRLLCHFSDRCASLKATDVDEVVMSHLRREFPRIGCHVNGQDPPLPSPDGSFDTVFSFSVWTHLSADDQISWLQEMRRVLRPGGLALISIHTEASVGEEMKLRAEWREAWLPGLQRDGFYFTSLSATGIAPTQAPSRYGYAVQTEEQVRRVWGKLFEVVEVSELVFRRHQTLVVLRKRPE